MFTGMLLSVFLIALDQTILVRVLPFLGRHEQRALKTGLSKAPALPVIASKFRALDKIVSDLVTPALWHVTDSHALTGLDRLRVGS